MCVIAYRRIRSISSTQYRSAHASGSTPLWRCPALRCARSHSASTPCASSIGRPFRDSWSGRCSESPLGWRRRAPASPSPRRGHRVGSLRHRWTETASGATPAALVPRSPGAGARSGAGPEWKRTSIPRQDKRCSGNADDLACPQPLQKVDQWQHVNIVPKRRPLPEVHAMTCRAVFPECFPDPMESAVETFLPSW